jgi:hypothetical protein
MRLISNTGIKPGTTYQRTAIHTHLGSGIADIFKMVSSTFDEGGATSANAVHTPPIVNEEKPGTAASRSDLTFDQRIQALPAELFNAVHDFTFDASVNGRRLHVKRLYKPPVQLQLCRTARKRLSADYYHTTKFCFTETRTMCAWLLALAPGYSIGSIVYIKEQPCVTCIAASLRPLAEALTRVTNGQAIDHVLFALHNSRIRIRAGKLAVVSTCVHCPKETEIWRS